MTTDVEVRTDKEVERLRAALSKLQDALHETFCSTEYPDDDMNVLTVADVRMLAMLAVTEAEFIVCTLDIEENGGRLEVFNIEGSKWVSNPSVVQRSDAGKRVKALQVEFGMSPSSRTRVKAAPKPEKKSALEELRDRRKA